MSRSDDAFERPAGESRRPGATPENGSGEEPRSGFAPANRRHAIAAAASALLAVALAVAIAGRGCGAEDETPEGAVRAFVSAARAGDRDAVYDLLGPRTRERLDADARRASDYVGGARRFAPRELLGVGGGADRPAPRDYVLVSREGDTAIVDIVDADGVRSPITVVSVGGRWRVEAP